MLKMSNSKGFTLIELLVVIAIIGILAAVVLIAIDPAQRIAEANDSGRKSRVSQVQAAIEACFTQKATGAYETACLTQAGLRTGGFLKTGSADLANVVVGPTTGPAANVVVYAPLTARSVGCTTGTGYFAYRSATGQAGVVCSTTVPAP